MESKIFNVEKADAGERLDLFLTKALNGISRSQIQKLIDSEKVLVNGAVVAKNTKLPENASVEVTGLQVAHDTTIQPQGDVPFDVVYEDEYIIAVNKPAGIVVHPGSGVHDGTLVNGLMSRFEMLADGFTSDRPGIVHRLDKETSGVLVVAKTNQVHAAMASLFQSREIKKTYIAFCLGCPSGYKGMIDLPLARSHQDPIKRTTSNHGKEARTEYEVIQYKSGIAAMCFRPLTGRTHQIRVHASSRGFPIVADKLYGGGKEHLLKIAPLDRPFAHGIMKCFKRHALHAATISFNHPITKKTMLITAPLPRDFNDACFRFGQTNLFAPLY
ncbi:MAG TPA: RluA family pseudouridine synthase [Chitinispirillaceae bacterium]|nr:RluA family pseudouridine synthase [Chitinispirillaceae bacterium]